MWLLSFITGTLGRWLIMGALGIAVVFGAYVKGRMDCTEAAAVAQLQADKAYLLAEIARREAKARADNAQAIEDREALAEMRKDNKELGHDLKELTGRCLGPDTVDRVRRGWRR